MCVAANNFIQLHFCCDSVGSIQKPVDKDDALEAWLRSRGIPSIVVRESKTSFLRVFYLPLDRGTRIPESLQARWLLRDGLVFSENADVQTITLVQRAPVQLDYQWPTQPLAKTLPNLLEIYLHTRDQDPSLALKMECIARHRKYPVNISYDGAAQKYVFGNSNCIRTVSMPAESSELNQLLDFVLGIEKACSRQDDVLLRAAVALLLYLRPVGVSKRHRLQEILSLGTISCNLVETSELVRTECLGDYCSPTVYAAGDPALAPFTARLIAWCYTPHDLKAYTYGTLLGPANPLTAVFSGLNIPVARGVPVESVLFGDKGHYPTGLVTEPSELVKALDEGAQRLIADRGLRDIVFSLSFQDVETGHGGVTDTQVALNRLAAAPCCFVGVLPSLRAELSQHADLLIRRLGVDNFRSEGRRQAKEHLAAIKEQSLDRASRMIDPAFRDEFIDTDVLPHLLLLEQITDTFLLSCNWPAPAFKALLNRSRFDLMSVLEPLERDPFAPPPDSIRYDEMSDCDDDRTQDDEPIVPPPAPRAPIPTPVKPGTSGVVRVRRRPLPKFKPKADHVTPPDIVLAAHKV